MEAIPKVSYGTLSSLMKVNGNTQNNEETKTNPWSANSLFGLVWFGLVPWHIIPIQ